MSNKTLNTVAGLTVNRKLQTLYLNIGTSAVPNWAAIGKRTEDSSMEYDWQGNSTKDILGNTWNTLKEPIVTQQFDPVKLDSGDSAVVKVWEKAVRDQDAQTLAAMDLLVVHTYAEGFAERYSACMVDVTSLGGEGGGDISMPFTVTFGGIRTLGAATVTGGVVTFTADTTALAVEPSAVTVAVNGTRIVKVTGNNGTVTATSAAASTATATATEDGYVAIKGVAAGSTTVTVTADGSNKTVSVTVTT